MSIHIIFIPVGTSILRNRGALVLAGAVALLTAANCSPAAVENATATGGQGHTGGDGGGGGAGGAGGGQGSGTGGSTCGLAGCVKPSDGGQSHINLSKCGDGVLDTALGEQCDDGIPPAQKVVQSPQEQCDDGKANGHTAGGCTFGCMTPHFCGDSSIDPGEQCDMGPLNGVPVDANMQKSDSPDAKVYCETDCTVNITVL